MKRGLLILGIIGAVYALVLFAATERPHDDPRFYLTAPIPADADTSYYEPGKHGGRVLIGSLGDPKSFNPLISSETSSSEVSNRMFSSLVGMDNSTQEITPGLAHSWEFSEDNLTLTFHMRRGVLWSDGVPVTAYDAKFTYDAIYDSTVASSYGDILRVNGEPFETAVVDSFTFRVTITDIFAPFLMWAGGLPLLPRHILEPELKKGTFDSSYNISWPPERLVTCGPYVLEKFESGVKTVLRRNPLYWRIDTEENVLPYLERVIFVNLRSSETMFLKFQSGDTDMLEVSKLADVPVLEAEQERGNYRVENLGSAMGQNMFWFNLNPGKKENGDPFVAPHKLAWFSDVRFRKAMAHAIDREGIAETVFGGRAQPQYGPETPANKFWYNPDLVRYDYNLDRTREYLDDMGLIDRNGDGIREDEDGHDVEFTMVTNTGNDQRELIGNIIKSDLANVGVRMDFNPIEFNTLIVKITNEFDYECCLLGLTSGDPDPSSGMSVWLSSGRMHQWYPNQPEPATEWEARIDELMMLQMSTLDKNKRKEYYDEVQYIMSDQVPYIYLVIPEVFVAVKNNFRNLVPTVLRHRLLWNVESVWQE